MNAAVKKDVPWIGLWVATTVLLGSAPYIVGYASQTDAVRFAGYVHLYPEDVCNHLSWAKQAYDGHFLLEDKYNAKENPESLVFNLLFLLIGWTARLLNWPLMWGFHLERVVATVLLLLLVYFFASQFFESRLLKWTALLLISFSSGLGWLTILGVTNFWTASDLWMTEVSTFIHGHTDVVITPSVLLMLTAFHFGLRHVRTGRTGYAVGAGLATLGLGAVHPHNLVTVFAVFFVHTLTRILSEPDPFDTFFSRKPWLLLACLTLFTFPIAAYHLYSMILQPHFFEYATIQDSIPAGELLPGYGLPGLFAVVGIVSVISHKDSVFYFLLVWLLCAFALIFTPLPLAGQYYLCQGLHIPICLLAVKGLSALGAVVVRKWPFAFSAGGTPRDVIAGSLMFVFVCAASLTNVFVLADEIALASRTTDLPLPHRPLSKQTKRHTMAFQASAKGPALSPYFFPRDLLDACGWLGRSTRSSDVVLAPTYLSCFIPLLSGNRVYAAASHQTSNFSIKELNVRSFYSMEDAEHMYEFLKTVQIDYFVFWLPDGADRNRVSDRIVRSLPATKVYENPRVVIFRFHPDGSRRVRTGDRR